MELRQLRHFVAVAEELHFGHAADRLGMTQPPLSQSIQRLESELGVRLFERTHRSVELTAVGGELLDRVRDLLARADTLPGLAQQLLRGDVGLLRLAFVSTADYGVLPELLRRYRSAFADVQIELLETTGDRQIERLLADEIDVGIVIGTGGETLPAALTYQPLHRERLMVAVAQSSLDDSAPIQLEEIAATPLVIFPRRVAPSLHDAITGCYAARGLVPRFGQEAIQMQTIVSLVSAGLGCAIVPESLRNLQRTGVVYRELAGESPVIETGLIWRQESARPTVHNFVRMARA